MSHDGTHPDIYQQMLHDDYAEEEEGRKAPLLQLEIELENGSKVYIKPQPCDEPVRLATEFCEEHNLDSEMIDILAESIKKSISHSIKKESSMNTENYPNHNYASHNCKATQSVRSPQYFSKKFSVNSSLSLYEKGLMREDAKRHWLARQHEHKIIQEMRECTHHPKINKLSRSLITQRESHSREHSHNHRHSRNIESVRSSILIDSKHSEPSPLPLLQRKHDSNASKSSSSVFLKLYEHRRPDQISRSKIISQMLKEETHHPVINDISKQIVGGANFNQRLARYQRQKIDKHSRLKRKEEAEKENMHKPKIGAPPHNRNVEGLPIGDFLYSKKKKAPLIKKEVQQPRINHTSHIIHQKRKTAAFLRIFEHLAGKRSGKMDWRLIDSDRIDPRILPIIRPLLEEIEILQIELSQEDFKTAINFLFNTLSPTDKDALLRFPLPMHPTLPKAPAVEINKNSEAIARNIGRSKLSIYDFCEIKQAMRVERMEQERVEKQRREMKECTFEPRIDRRIYY